MLHHMGHSTAEAVKAAVDEACRTFPDQPGMILFYSDGERFPAFSGELHQRYPRTVVLGASTHSSFSPEGFCLRGINAVAMTGNLRVSPGLIREISRNPSFIYRDVVRGALKDLGGGPFRPDDTGCLVLNPAGTASEEAVLDTLDDALRGTGIPVFGGSASSEVCASGAVSLDGHVYANSSVFVLFHLEDSCFVITKEDIFGSMGPSFKVTQADTRRRTLYALDGRLGSAL